MIRIPTGNERLDAELGGGIPLGSIVEVFGPPYCGKTQFALNLITANQSDRPKLFIDSDWALGRNKTDYRDGRILLCQPENAERAISIAGRSISQTDIIVIDTVASLVTSTELDENHSPRENSMQRVSLLAAFLHRNEARFRVYECLLLLLNHEYEGHDTPGGKAVHNESVIRIRLHGPPHYGATVVKNVFSKSKP